MRVNHPAILGGCRSLDRIEESAVRLFLAEEAGMNDNGAFREWWNATKSHCAFTGQDITECRDYSWSWAARFAHYCEES